MVNCSDNTSLAISGDLGKRNITYVVTKLISLRTSLFDSQWPGPMGQMKNDQLPIFCSEVGVEKRSKPNLLPV